MNALRQIAIGAALGVVAAAASFLILAATFLTLEAMGILA